MKNINYTAIGGFIALLLIIDGMQISKNRDLQTQLDELRIIVNQKALPSLILDTLNVR